MKALLENPVISMYSYIGLFLDLFSFNTLLWLAPFPCVSFNTLLWLAPFPCVLLVLANHWFHRRLLIRHVLCVYHSKNETNPDSHVFFVRNKHSFIRHYRHVSLHAWITSNCLLRTILVLVSRSGHAQISLGSALF